MGKGQGYRSEAGREGATKARGGNDHLEMHLSEFPSSFTMAINGAFCEGQA